MNIECNDEINKILYDDIVYTGEKFGKSPAQTILRIQTEFKHFVWQSYSSPTVRIPIKIVEEQANMSIDEVIKRL